MSPMIGSERNFEYLHIGWNTYMVCVRNWHKIIKEKQNKNKNSSLMGYFFFFFYRSLKNIVRIVFRARDMFQNWNHKVQKRNNELFPIGIKSHCVGYIISWFLSLQTIKENDAYGFLFLDFAIAKSQFKELGDWISYFYKLQFLKVTSIYLTMD